MCLWFFLLLDKYLKITGTAWVKSYCAEVFNVQQKQVVPNHQNAASSVRPPPVPLTCVPVSRALKTQSDNHTSRRFFALLSSLPKDPTSQKYINFCLSILERPTTKYWSRTLVTLGSFIPFPRCKPTTEPYTAPCVCMRPAEPYVPMMLTQRLLLVFFCFCFLYIYIYI